MAAWQQIRDSCVVFYKPSDQMDGKVGDFPKRETGASGYWWHENNRGPLSGMPFIRQFGHMKFTKINLDENMKPHLNDGIEIHYVESGKYSWEFEGRSVELLPDDLSVTAPWHLNGSPSGKMDLGEINWLILKPEEFLPGKPLRLGSWTRLPGRFQKNLGELLTKEEGIVLRNAVHFKQYFTELVKELTERRKGYQLVVVNILENLLVQLERSLERRNFQNSGRDSFIHDLYDTICANLMNKWLVEELAERYGMGKTKFTEEVKRLTGYPPNSYIINIKIDKAKNLLMRSEEATLSDIAYDCGFSSLQHFSSSFCQRTGLTPTAFRRRVIYNNSYN